MAPREARIQPHHMGERPIVEVYSKAWVLVRRADLRGTMPFVISRKEWDALPKA